jgi:hypothetical protein
MFNELTLQPTPPLLEAHYKKCPSLDSGYEM